MTLPEHRVGAAQVSAARVAGSSRPAPLLLDLLRAARAHPRQQNACLDEIRDNTSRLLAARHAVAKRKGEYLEEVFCLYSTGRASSKRPLTNENSSEGPSITSPLRSECVWFVVTGLTAV